MAEVPMTPTGNTLMHQIIAQALTKALAPIHEKLDKLSAQLDRIEGLDLAKTMTKKSEKSA